MATISKLKTLNPACWPPRPVASYSGNDPLPGSQDSLDLRVTATRKHGDASRSAIALETDQGWSMSYPIEDRDTRDRVVALILSCLPATVREIGELEVATSA